MFCQKCGEKNNAEAKFCIHCGEPTLLDGSSLGVRVKAKVKSIHELKHKSWYRLLKVLYLSFFLLIFITTVSIIIAGNSRPIFDNDRSYIVCNDGRNLSLSENSIYLSSNYIPYYDQDKVKTMCAYNPNDPTKLNEPTYSELSRMGVNYKLVAVYDYSNYLAMMGYLLLAVVIILALFELIRRIFYYISLGRFNLSHSDNKKDDNTKLKPVKGAEGWLTFVGLGLIVTPLLAVFNLFQIDWSGFSEFSSDLQSLILIEQLVSLVVAGFAVYLLYLMAKSKKQFPLFYIIWASCSIIFMFGDYAISYSIFSNYEMTPEITTALSDVVGQVGRSIVAGAIWIPYMLLSRRVKATFTK
jgi:uncharacterized membrane-anchored protein